MARRRRRSRRHRRTVAAVGLSGAATPEIYEQLEQEELSAIIESIGFGSTRLAESPETRFVIPACCSDCY